MPFDENGYTQPGGTYYLFDLYASAPEIEENPQLPAGTYTLGEAGLTEEYTFTPDYSMWNDIVRGRGIPHNECNIL